MAEEQTPQGVQDPVQPAAPAPAEPAQTQQYTSNAPWANDLSQFGEVAPAVDTYLRERWQPRMTQLEQQAAQAEQGRQLLEAFQQDPDAANVSIQRQLYGDEYANALAAQLGRADLVAGQPAQVQTPAAPQQQQQDRPGPGDPVYDYWAEKYQQEQYDAAKSDFLRDPQYADINSELFDPFVASAETWEEAVANYRAYAAQFSTAAQPAQEPAPAAPPTLGSQAGGTPGSTPTYPHETLNEAIDGIFSERQPVAPTVMGGQ